MPRTENLGTKPMQRKTDREMNKDTGLDTEFDILRGVLGTTLELEFEN
jgi:hypothetical protein